MLLQILRRSYSPPARSSVALPSLNTECGPTLSPSAEALTRGDGGPSFPSVDDRRPCSGGSDDSDVLPSFGSLHAPYPSVSRQLEVSQKETAYVATAARAFFFLVWFLLASSTGWRITVVDPAPHYSLVRNQSIQGSAPSPALQFEHPQPATFGCSRPSPKKKRSHPIPDNPGCFAAPNG